MNEKYPLALPKGTVLAGQYIIEKVLGQGGFGITYEATDHKTNGRVAVKEFFPDAMATRTNQTTVMPFTGENGEHYAYGKTCFLQEAETLAKFIGNENIVRIHSYFEENGTAYFVMDFIEGTSFDEYLKQRGGKIPYEEAAGILIPVMDALNVVHSKGIIHRDVTPDNIYITKDGVVKLLDFGAARYSLGDQSRSLDVILKHGFAPKEQYTRRGRQGPYTDIYALGATFYFALTGKRPPDSVERMDEDDLVPPSSLGVQLSGAAEDAILKALSVQPGDRFQSMAAFKSALLGQKAAAQPAPVAAGSGPAAVQTYFTPPAQTVPAPGQSETQSTAGSAAQSEAGRGPAKPLKNKKLILASAGAAVLVLVIGILVFQPGRKKTSAPPKETYAAAFSPDEVQMSPTPKPTAAPAPTATPKPTASPTPTAAPTPADSLSGDWTVISNTAENIMNGGIKSRKNETEYILADGGHSIYEVSAQKYIFQNEEGLFSNLFILDGQLYYLYEGGLYSYAPDTNKRTEYTGINEHFQYGIQRLMMTKDFYVICSQNSDGTSTVSRLSRVGGACSTCCTIENENCFTMSDDGWIYYAKKDSDGLSRIYRKRLDVLGDEFSLVRIKNSDFSNPIVAGSYLYYYSYSNEVYTIRRMDREAGYKDTDPAWRISAEPGMEHTSMISFNVHYQHQTIYFCVWSADDEKFNLYSLKGYDDGTFDMKLISENAFYPNFTFFNESGDYEVVYLRMGEGDSDYKIYYMTFDAAGNQIKNK